MNVNERAIHRSPTSARRSFDLNSPRALALARLLVPLLFGLYSVFLGADSNWDLLNYHLYNPYAWLNGRLQTDLAPAGMQSYFNPLLDLPYYWMSQHFPARLAGFAMGVLHGLNFVLLLSIARSATADADAENRYRRPLLLALAGCLVPCFLSQIGNTMGDNTTALLVLGGLAILLSHWDRIKNAAAGAALLPAASGLLVGMGIGLKPTTACYAVAMCAALLTYPARLATRIRIAFVFGIGVLAGWAATGGYWMLHMWHLFGNPLYPQFGQFFPNPLTQPIGSGDVRFLPHGIMQSILRPLVMAIDPSKVAGLSREIVWPIVWALLLFTFATAIARRLRRDEPRRLDSRARFIVAFVAIGYLVWMKVFSIYRYLVPVEMLAPIVVFALVTFLKRGRAGGKTARWLIGAIVVTGVIGGLKTWGHEGWRDPVFHVDVPPIAAPARATVILYSVSGARAWMVPFFPPQIAFASIASSFPATNAYNERVRDMVISRGGQGYALIDGDDDWRAQSVAGADKLVGKLGLTDSDQGCAKLKWAVSRLHLHASVEDLSEGAKKCRLTVRADDAQKAAMTNKFALDEAVQAFSGAGLELQLQTCKPYYSSIGTHVGQYRFCDVKAR